MVPQTYAQMKYQKHPLLSDDMNRPGICMLTMYCQIIMYRNVREIVYV